MNYESLLKKEKVEIDGRKFAISAIPCEQAHPIWCECLSQMGDKLTTFGFTHLPAELTNRIISYCAANEEGKWVMLDDEENRNRLIKDEPTFIQLILAMCKKNFGFFFDGSLFQWLSLLEGAELPESNSDFHTRT